MQSLDVYKRQLDNSLFDKLQVFDGDSSPMLEPNNNAIAIAVSLDDYGNLPNPESVSYTHLDVYKRQGLISLRACVLVMHQRNAKSAASVFGPPTHGTPNTVAAMHRGTSCTALAGRSAI